MCRSHRASSATCTLFEPTTDVVSPCRRSVRAEESGAHSGDTRKPLSQPWCLLMQNKERSGLRLCVRARRRAARAELS